MEKLLGKWYKWWYITKYEWSRSGATPFADILFQVNIFITNTLWVYVWSLTSPTTAIYLLSGKILSYFINNYWYNRIGQHIVSGKLTNLLLTPSSLFLIYFFESLGGRIFRNLLALITLFLVILMFSFSGLTLPFSNFNYWVFVLIPFLFFINFSMNFLISSIAFFLKDKRDFMTSTEIIQQILNVLSGSFIPLNTIPFLGLTLVYLPISLLFYHPAQIFLGKYSFAQTTLVFAIMIIFSILLFFVAKLVFKLGLKRNESVGL